MGKENVEAGYQREDATAKDALWYLEKKIDALNELFYEQTKLLSSIKEDITAAKIAVNKSRCDNFLASEFLKEALAQSSSRVSQSVNVLAESDSNETVNYRARLLLDAIESKGFNLDRGIRDALVNFLQSDELKVQVVNATADSVKGVIKEHLSGDLASKYLPMLERSHRRLLKHITKVLDQNFAELEESSSAFCNYSIYKTSRCVRRALDRQRALTETVVYRDNHIENIRVAIKEVLDKELKFWREETMHMMKHSSQAPSSGEEIGAVEPRSKYPLSNIPLPNLPELADSKMSIIDRLLTTAAIKKKIEDGDVNGAFEMALSAGDLALVVAACRAARGDGTRLDPTCTLSQSALLSLIQQLATDMVQDTQLKCRYLEEAFVNINIINPTTRSHLPVVLDEVRKHLTNFLTKYPNHAANRKITLIVLAATNLLQ